MTNPAKATPETLAREALKDAISQLLPFAEDGDQQAISSCIEKCRQALAALFAPAERQILPCDVHLPPGTFIRKGCKVATLMLAISQREKFPQEDTVFDIAKMIAGISPAAPAERLTGEAVPDEPTKEMAEAGRKALALVADRMETAKLTAVSVIDFWQQVGHEPANEIYKAMLAARPAAPALTAGTERETDDIVAGNTFRETLVPRADSSAAGGFPLWHGWALMEAFLAGTDHGRALSAAPAASRADKQHRSPQGE